jgi:hypothetical protein
MPIVTAEAEKQPRRRRFPLWLAGLAGGLGLALAMTMVGVLSRSVDEVVFIGDHCLATSLSQPSWAPPLPEGLRIQWNCIGRGSVAASFRAGAATVEVLWFRRYW